MNDRWVGDMSKRVKYAWILWFVSILMSLVMFLGVVVLSLLAFAQGGVLAAYALVGLYQLAVVVVFALNIVSLVKSGGVKDNNEKRKIWWISGASLAICVCLSSFGLIWMLGLWIVELIMFVIMPVLAVLTIDGKIRQKIFRVLAWLLPTLAVLGIMIYWCVVGMLFSNQAQKDREEAEIAREKEINTRLEEEARQQQEFNEGMRAGYHLPDTLLETVNHLCHESFEVLYFDETNSQGVFWCDDRSYDIYAVRMLQGDDGAGDLKSEALRFNRSIHAELHEYFGDERLFEMRTGSVYKQVILLEASSVDDLIERYAEKLYQAVIAAHSDKELELRIFYSENLKDVDSLDEYVGLAKVEFDSAGDLIMGNINGEEVRWANEWMSVMDGFEMPEVVNEAMRHDWIKVKLEPGKTYTRDEFIELLMLGVRS